MRCIILPSVPRLVLAIFSHYRINSTIFGEKLFNIKCVLIFSTTFIWNIYHFKKNSARHYHIISINHKLMYTLRLKCDGTRTETRFRLSAKRTSAFKSAGRQFSRLMTAKVCASAVVMLYAPCSKVVWRVLATHSIHPFTSPPMRHWVPSHFFFTIQFPAILVCANPPNSIFYSNVEKQWQ